MAINNYVSDEFGGYMLNAEVGSTLPEYTAADAGKALTVNEAGTGVEWAEDVSDLPEYTAADAGKALTVNEAGTGVEWAEDVSDLPEYAAADAGKTLTVNESGTGVEWAEDVSDLPEYTAADAGKALTVNEAGTGVEWKQPSGSEIFFVNWVAGAGGPQMDKTWQEIYNALATHKPCFFCSLVQTGKVSIWPITTAWASGGTYYIDYLGGSYDFYTDSADGYPMYHGD